MASLLGNFVSVRAFTTSASLWGKRNFRKFNIYEKRISAHTRRHYKGKIPLELQLHYNRGVRSIGGLDKNGKLTVIPEMIPEFIVPDLEGFKLKPYVSYRVPNVIQSEFTPQDLFYAIYSKKIMEDLKNNASNEDGSPKDPSAEEKLRAEEAKQRALATGSDIYG